jgi:hypothetical protein
MENTSLEDRHMWFYVQMALPLLTIGLAAAICLSVTSTHCLTAGER